MNLLCVIIVVLVIIVIWLIRYPPDETEKTRVIVEQFPRPTGKLGRIDTPIPAPRPSERQLNEAIARAGLSQLWAANQANDINDAPAYSLYDGHGNTKYDTKGYDMEEEIRIRAALRETSGLY